MKLCCVLSCPRRSSCFVPPVDNLSTHLYSCVVIPGFESGTGNLPPGEHPATWDEIVERFGTSDWRKELLAGLKAALLSLREAGCNRVYLDGSFVTAKERPGDFDGCWDTGGVDFDRVDEVLLTFDQGRTVQKAKYRGELFLADGQAEPEGTVFREFFQRDRDGNSKGIIVIDLRDIK